jgi:2-polyprenyl-3-methyl-5-hydroxy-6-metoxy-1,4-benzoquinol methylase
MNETLDVEKYVKEPIKENLKTLFSHLGRYYYAIKKLKIDKDDTVMDIGCGEGYGSYLISKKAKLVLGVDIKHEVLKKAAENFAHEYLYFSTYEYYKKLKLKINKIICLETIEHMTKKKIELFLENILSGFQGEIFLSFPVGNNNPCKYNKYHKCEPSIEYIESLLAKNNYTEIEIEVDDFENNYGYEQVFCFIKAKELS